MKKLYTTILAALLGSAAFSQNGQIPNGGFENWQSITLYDYTTVWGSSNQDQFSGTPATFKSTDAQLGTYSAEIRSVATGPNPDTLFGYVYHGTIGATGPDGGIPYTPTFNTIKFQYKCDLPVANDSVYLYVIRFVGGTIVDFVAVQVVGGTHSTWTQGSVTISAIPQDEIFIGFVMGDPINNNLNAPGGWARFDNVEMYNGAVPVTNVPDPSFEAWATATTENPVDWSTMNEMLAGMSLETVIKTTDAFAGTYAVEISTLLEPTNNDTINGFITWGPLDFMSMNPFLPAPYNASPTTFSGNYKYAPANGDQANIQIIFFQGGIPIGSHTELLTNQATYTAFSSPLTIGGTPDSIVFLAFSGDNPGSVLKLDNLMFSGGNVGLEEFSVMSVSVYPNPATNVVMIKAEGTYSYELVNLSGAIVRTANGQVGAQEINISDLQAGSYFLRINNSTSTEVHKLIIE